MRPQQQNRRMRGRGNNNNRKGPNPLTRNYESNGPDVKIRGSAQQVADKYTVLARDAQSSGDRVMAENYLQHAEHYNRIIAAAQAQQGVNQQRDNRDDDYDGDDERDDGDSDNNNRQQRNDDQQRQPETRAQANDGTGPQPVIEGVPAEVAHTQGGQANGETGDGQANGHAKAEQTGDEEGGRKRQRRPRRSAKSRGDDTEAGEGQGGEPAAEPAVQN